jgi:hypothetical protein
MKSNLSEHAEKLIRSLYAEKGFLRSLVDPDQQESFANPDHWE